MPKSLKEQALGEALGAATQIRDEEHRADAMGSLAPYLSEALLSEALAAASQIQDETYRMYALSYLAPHLPESLLVKALAAASQIQNKTCRAEALGSLAPSMPRWAQNQPARASTAWTDFLQSRASHPRSDLLSDFSILLPFCLALLSEPNRPQASADIFHAIQEICGWEW